MLDFKALKRATVRDNAKQDELTAYLALCNSLLSYGKFYVGDRTAKGEPDIISKDNSIGVEVVAIDIRDGYRHSKYRLGGTVFTFMTTKDKKIDKTEEKIATKKMLKNKKVLKSYKQTRKDKLSRDPHRQEVSEYYTQFKRLVDYKHRRLEEGAYSASIARCLYIDSNYSYKPYLNLKRIKREYDAIAKKFDVKYDLTIINIEDRLYNVETLQEINKNDSNLQDKVTKQGIMNRYNESLQQSK